MAAALRPGGWLLVEERPVMAAVNGTRMACRPGGTARANGLAEVQGALSPGAACPG
jgi:hypothetical protein